MSGLIAKVMGASTVPAAAAGRAFRQLRSGLKVGLVALPLAVGAQTEPEAPGISSTAAAMQPTAMAPWAAALEPGQDLPLSALLAVEVLPVQVPDPERSEIRAAESSYMAYELRQTLESAAQFGPVRMLSAPSAGHELVIHSALVRSNSRHLTLAVRATDASGRNWIDDQYEHTASPEDYANGTEPFAALYQHVTADLIGYRNRLTIAELKDVTELARLRRAATLAPSAFGGYVKESGGRYQINRLPAENDPLIARINRIADAQALFADAVDPNFARFHKDMGPTYILWRKTLFESEQVMANYREKSARKSARDKSARSIYNELRELKLYQQTIRETMESFVFRMQPTRLEVNGEIMELGGTLSQQTQRWQEILNQLFAAELGLDTDSP